jgi:hypothetical protein
VSIFFDLFSPGNRFRDEELKRLENTRTVDGVSEPGSGPIDLTSGKVLMKATAEQAEEAERATRALKDEPIKRERPARRAVVPEPPKRRFRRG